MPSKENYFQPGAILHEAIVGAFKARGGSFEHWCRDQGLQPTAVRNATFGQSRGPRGKELLGLISVRDVLREVVDVQKFLISQLEHYITGDGR